MAEQISGEKVDGQGHKTAQPKFEHTHMLKIEYARIRTYSSENKVGLRVIQRWNCTITFERFL